MLVWAAGAPLLLPSPLGMGKCYIIGSNNSSGVQFTFDSSNIFGDQLNRGNATKALVAMQWTLSLVISDNPQGLVFFCRPPMVVSCLTPIEASHLRDHPLLVQAVCNVHNVHLSIMVSLVEPA